MIHFFDTEIAVKYGVNAAILLQNIAYWCELNEANEVNYYDGTYWTYNSRKALAALFPYMSERQIGTAIQKLIDAGLIICGNYNKMPYDRTMWYALSKNGKSIMQKCKMEDAVLSNDNMQKCQTNTRYIPNNNTDNKTDIDAAKPQKHKHGEFKHVLLTDADYQKLIKDFGETVAATYIRKVDEYCEQSGKRYKNYYLAIRNTFMARDGVKPQGEQSLENGRYMKDGVMYDRYGNEII